MGGRETGPVGADRTEKSFQLHLVHNVGLSSFHIRPESKTASWLSLSCRPQHRDTTAFRLEHILVDSCCSTQRHLQAWQDSAGQIFWHRAKKVYGQRGTNCLVVAQTHCYSQLWWWAWMPELAVSIPLPYWKAEWGRSNSQSHCFDPSHICILNFFFWSENDYR